MSLERAALRLATVMALANGFVAPYPTMAGGYVFDSRLDPVQIASGDEIAPLILVCTDDDKGSSISANNGGPPFEREVALIIDLALAMQSEGVVGAPRTEPELELRLDLLEAQVERVLTERAGVWGRQFGRIARRITEWHSVRYVDTGNVRMLARQLQLTVALPLNEMLEALTVIGTAPTATVPPPLGSLLDAIIGSGSPFAPQATVLRDQLLSGGAGRYTALPPLQRVRIVESDHGGGLRPDGVADVTLPQ